MEIVNFNDNFSGFTDQEHVLIDTGVVLALANKYDTWHQTVSELFENHVFDNENVIFLYVNPTIVNECTHIAGKPLENYLKKHSSEHFSYQDVQDTIDQTVDFIKTLVENEVFLVLDGRKDSVLKQIDLYKELGSADAVNTAIAHVYGTSFLTIDNKLVNNIWTNRDKLSGIKRVYYSTPVHRTY